MQGKQHVEENEDGQECFHISKECKFTSRILLETIKLSVRVKLESIEVKEHKEYTDKRLQRFCKAVLKHSGEINANVSMLTRSQWQCYHADVL